MDVSENSGTPKWMVYNGKPYKNGWFGGITIFGSIHIWIWWNMFPMKLVYSRPPKVWCFGPQIPNPPKPPLYMYPDHPLRYHEINFICFELVFPTQMPYILRSRNSYTTFHPTQPTIQPWFHGPSLMVSLTTDPGLTSFPNNAVKSWTLENFQRKSMGNRMPHGDSCFWTVFCGVNL